MQSPYFKKTPLATGIAIALGASVLTPAAAQEEVIEEVIVTGIRGSLMSSMETKRNARGVVEAITAEDIGQFPDTNLAESMQRIPGVSIDRVNNEGSRVTVRGFGPEFNLVLLNGRQMPGTDLSIDSVRSFDFANLATEGISAVKVFKTFNASMPSGGIGSTIDIRTARPFDNPGFVASFGVKALSDTTNEKGDDWTPEVSGIISSTFADDRFGAGLFFSHQRRDSREVSANVAEQFWRENVDAAIPDSATVTDNRAPGVTDEFFPRALGLTVSDVERTRTNGQLVLQMAPTDTFEATLDYTYAEFENLKSDLGAGIWFNDGDAQNVVLDENGAAVFVGAGAGDYTAQPAIAFSENTNESIGLNLDWQVSDNLTLVLDAHDSSAETRPLGRGSNVFAVIAAVCMDSKTMDTTNGADVPDMLVTWGSCLGSAPGEEPTGTAYDSLFANALADWQNSDVTQVQFSGEWANGSSDYGVTSIQFGLASTDTDFRVRRWDDGQVGAGWYGGNQDVFDDSIFTRVDSSGLLSEFSGFASPGFYHDVNIEDVLVPIEQTFNGGDPIAVDYSSTPLEDHSIKEETTSAYVQFNVEGDFNGVPVTVVGGIRYEDTDIAASSLQVETTEITWINGEEWSVNQATEQSFSDVRDNYSKFLPNLDVAFDVRDDMVARFSYSKSITRPSLTAMRGTTSVTTRPKPGQRDGNAGNPGLEPYTADNFDLSFEWYYGEGSYASVTHFRKRVDNFLVSTTTQGVTFEDLGLDVGDPDAGAQAELARQQLTDEGLVPENEAVFARINENIGAPLGTPVRAEPGDPPVEWSVTQTTNARVGNLWGWEFQVQHMWDMGFGIQANLTTVSGDVDADRNVIGEQFALPGLSDSANVVAFYENDWMSARVAWNWRDEYLLTFDANDAPVFFEEYQQVDLNFTWYAMERLDVFFEALNVTEETIRQYIRYEEQFDFGAQYGARYNIGARYSFD
jgi:TonB-dependent receptor